MSTITCEVKSLQDLMKMSLRIPEYQRPFVWDETHITTLLNNLHDHKEQNAEIPYIMGSAILHKEEKYNIVDGQQRLTTFTILLYLLCGCSECKYSKCTYYSLLNTPFNSLSHDNLFQAKKVIEEWLNDKFEDDTNKEADFLAYLLDEKIKFIVITTNSLDDAFIFFNSQNTRGKKLNNHDILKARHLRFVESDEMQKRYTQQWEQYEQDKDIKFKDFMDFYLGRCRGYVEENYTTSLRQQFEAIHPTTFEGKPHPLNHYMQPVLFDTWRYDSEQKKVQFTFQDMDISFGNGIKLQGDDCLIALPLQFPQQIEGGETFFLYVRKYYTLYKKLFVDMELYKHELDSDFIELVEVLNRCGNEHLFKLWKATMLFYYDKFGTNQLSEVACWMEHKIFKLRTEQRVYGNSSINKFVREKFNPLRIIHKAVYPDNIINEIRYSKELRYGWDKKKETPVKDYATEIQLYYKSRKTKYETICQYKNFNTITNNTQSDGEK